MQGYGQYNVPKITFYTYSLNTNNISYFYIKKLMVMIFLL